MAVIRLAKTPASAMDPSRRINGLLKNQIEHLQRAEFRLPANRQSDIYINDIKTEGEAAEYIKIVTAHLHPAGKTATRKSKSKVVHKIAAEAARKRTKKRKAKPKTKRKKR
jgi:hypothetical protein